MAGAWQRQRCLHGVAHRLMHLAAVAKPHFDLGRVHVDIDPGRVQRDVQRVNRLALAVQHVFVGAAGGVADHLVAHKTAIDVAKLLVGAGAGSIRDAGAAPDFDDRCVVGPARRGGAGKIDPDRALNEVAAQHVGQALFQRRQAVAVITTAPPLFDQFALVPDGETDIGAGQSVAAHGFHAMGQFGGIGLEELAPRRG
ncbi:hypothetical protein GALL_526440 [mine drainage metagenome]|uniref:Uncharacterized protein n=1 Tax=mine drainage metagenome TaxID=410659 RepID=A0A1J5P3W1_9ZZZZ